MKNIHTADGGVISVKGCTKDARFVDGYPSFLFFTPDGHLSTTIPESQSILLLFY